jgi:V8-like Glu-specific endopeptidase
MSILEEALYDGFSYQDKDRISNFHDDLEMLVDKEVDLLKNIYSCNNCRKNAIFEELRPFKKVPEEAIIPPSDTRKKIKKSSMKLAPYRYIVNLEYHFPVKGKITMGTGVLVGPRTVLTAGHNLDIKSFNKNRMFVTPARFAVSYRPFGVTNLTGFHRPSNYQRSTPTDLALLYLKKPLGSKAGYWSIEYKNRSFDPIGTRFIEKGPIAYPGNFKVNLIGYPGDKPSDLKFGCRLPGKGCQVAPVSSKVKRVCGTFQYGSFEDTNRFVKDIINRKLDGQLLRLLTYENDTCQVNSGSPVYVKRHSSEGGRVLYGIHVGAFKNSSGKVLENGAVYLLPWINYIKSRVK